MLHLYRRHRKHCEAHRPEESRTGEFHETKGSKRCACLIFASGAIGKKFSRKCTGTTDWAAARALTDAWQAADTWDGEAPAPPVENPSRRITIKDATEAFLANRQNRGIKQATLAKYRTFTKQLLAYTNAQGYVLMSQLTVAEMDRFGSSTIG